MILTTPENRMCLFFWDLRFLNIIQNLLIALIGSRGLHYDKQWNNGFPCHVHFTSNGPAQIVLVVSNSMYTGLISKESSRYSASSLNEFPKSQCHEDHKWCERGHWYWKFVASWTQQYLEKNSAGPFPDNCKQPSLLRWTNSKRNSSQQAKK